jgi:hypothetical protein
MRDSQSSATEVGDYRKTSKGAVILPQAMWEVQVIGVADREKLSKGDGKAHRFSDLVHRNTIGFLQIERGKRRGSVPIAVSVSC